MDLGTCPRCRTYRINPQDCGCQSFTVWLSEAGESDGNHIFATDAEDAAERFCAHYDRMGGEYSIVQSGHTKVTVRDNQTGKVQRFDIEASMQPVYMASWDEDIEEEVTVNG